MASGTRSKRALGDAPPPSAARRREAPVGPNTIVKIIKKGRNHNGVVYKLGSDNHCAEDFDPITKSEKGGVYGCELRAIFKWLYLYRDNAHELAFVSFPTTAQVVWFGSKFKASQITIEKFVPIKEGIAVALTVATTQDIDFDMTCEHVANFGSFASLQKLCLLFEHELTPSEKRVALQLSVRMDNTSMIKDLLQHGVDPDPFSDGSILHGAVSMGRTQTALLLYAATKNPLRSLLQALKTSHIQAVDTCRALLNEAGVASQFILEAAVRGCSFKNRVLNDELLDSPETPSSVIEELLCGVVKNGGYLSKKLLASADVNARNGEPLLTAIYNEHHDNVLSLLSAGANPDIRDGAPLRAAICKDSMAIARALLDWGADPNARGGMPLHYAILGILPIRIISLLITAGASASIHGGEPVINAVRSRSLMVVEAVLAGAGLYDRFEEARALAAGYEDKSILNALNKHRADALKQAARPVVRAWRRR